MSIEEIAAKALSEEIEAAAVVVTEIDGRMVLTYYQHIDDVWLWLRREGQLVVLSTYRSAWDRLKDHPGITYVISASVNVRVLAEHDAQMLKEMQRFVREGRLELVGGWVTEADCHVPSGEALCRLELHGNADFAKYFDYKINIAMNADAFGHDPGVIQVVTNAGKKAYVYLRPSDIPRETDLDRITRWEDQFGRGITAARLTEGYNAGPNTITPRIKTCSDDMKMRQLPVTLVLAGLGNHGGELSERLTDIVDDLQTKYPIDYGSIADYLAQIDKPGLPVVVGDKLKHHARGSYSAHLAYKKLIRDTEQRLLAAEKMLAMLALTGLPRSNKKAKKIVKRHSRKLAKAWSENFLPALFHDLAAGTAIRAGHDEAMDMLRGARATAQRALDAATLQIVWNIRTPGNAEVTPIVVFNPSGHDASIPTEFTIDSHVLTKPHLTTSDGVLMNCQRIPSDSVTSSRKRFAFVAEVPAFGYEVYWLSQAPSVPEPTAKATNTMIRTNLLELWIDPKTGQIRKLVDRRSGHGIGQEAIVLKDDSDTWSHGVAGYTELDGKFRRAKVRLTENGPLRSVISSHSRFGTSELVQQYIVYHDSPTVEIRSKLLWTGRRQVLKMDYAHGLQDAKILVEGSYGFNADRTEGEQPMQKWLNVTGKTADGTEASIAIITDSLHAYDAPEGHVRLTVSRTPVYAHHDPQILEPDLIEFYDWMDQGEHHFRTLLMLGTEAADVAKVSAAAAAFSQPPVYLVSTLRPTAMLEQTASFAQIVGDEVQMSACKRSLKDDGWIVRLFNPAPQATTATLQFGGRQATLELGPSAFATAKLPDGSDSVAEVTILE